ncbi:MAG TPA: hypothetical protein ENJ55_01965, partial [Rhizobiales bacterium]|nr:hypothetical protein [Hyphomicrobiales bacterium]
NAMGYRVSPVEVETALLQHKDVEQAAVCTINVRENVDIITGFVVPVNGARIKPAEIIEYISNLLADYKLPKKLLVVDALPCNSSGKLIRKNLPGLTGTGWEMENDK